MDSSSQLPLVHTWRGSNSQHYATIIGRHVRRQRSIPPANKYSPTGFGLGSSGSTRVHWTSVRSVGYRDLDIPTDYQTTPFLYRLLAMGRHYRSIPSAAASSRNQMSWPSTGCTPAAGGASSAPENTLPSASALSAPVTRKQVRAAWLSTG